MVRVTSGQWYGYTGWVDLVEDGMVFIGLDDTDNGVGADYAWVYLEDLERVDQMARYVVVNKNNVKWNLTHEDKKPVLSLHDGNNPVVYGDEIVIFDPDGWPVGKFVYKPTKPKGCGASVWFEILGPNEAVVTDPQSYSEVCNV